MTERGDDLVVVSFFHGERYYHDAAERLRADCHRLGLDHDICRLTPSGESLNWIDICRRKVPFIREMHRKHARPILWLDVDSRIAHRPVALLGNVKFDFAAFLRGMRYLRDFDSEAVPRVFAPWALYFNATPPAEAFLELMARLEREYQGAATDDYFLQEAWLRHEQEMAVLVLPPHMVGREWPLKPSHVFFVGISGNVPSAAKVAKQHEVALPPPAQWKAALVREGSASLKDNPKDALVLWRHALTAGGPDDALAGKIARLTQRLQGLAPAVEFLRRYQGEHSSIDHAARFEAQAELDAGNLERAEDLMAGLLRHGSEDDTAWASSSLHLLTLEARARALGVEPDQRPALWWRSGMHAGNVLDLIGPFLVERLSGLPPRLTRDTPAVIAGGTSVGVAREGWTVWGGGLATAIDNLDPAADFRAVRGPLTLARLRQLGHEGEVATGEPAWLLPHVYQPGRITSPVPVAVVVDGPARAQEWRGVPLLAASRCGEHGVKAFIDDLHGCQRILTSSLAALATCHAYGIPARWVTIDSLERQPADATPFIDYLSSVGMSPDQCLPLAIDDPVACLERDPCGLPSSSIDHLALLRCAPFPTTLSPRAPKSRLSRWLARRVDTAKNQRSNK